MKREIAGDFLKLSSRSFRCEKKQSLEFFLWIGYGLNFRRSGEIKRRST